MGSITGAVIRRALHTLQWDWGLVELDGSNGKSRQIRDTRTEEVLHSTTTMQVLQCDRPPHLNGIMMSHSEAKLYKVRVKGRGITLYSGYFVTLYPYPYLPSLLVWNSIVMTHRDDIMDIQPIRKQLALSSANQNEEAAATGVSHRLPHRLWWIMCNNTRVMNSGS